MIQKIVKLRYAKPLIALKEDSFIKTVIAALGSLGAFLYDMFYVEPELIALLVIAVFIDFITGVVASKRNKMPFTSLGLRQSIVKTIEYAAFLLILTGMSNIFGDMESNGWVSKVLSALNNVDYFGYLYLILTELKSIGENLTGAEGRLSQLFKEIKQKVLDAK